MRSMGNHITAVVLVLIYFTSIVPAICQTVFYEAFSEEEPDFKINIKGRIIDQNKEEIAFGSVVLYKDEVIVTAVASDFDGIYLFNNIERGIYRMKAYYLGHKTPTLYLDLNEVNLLSLDNYTLSIDDLIIEEMSLTICYKYFYPNIINFNDPSTKTTFSRESISRSPLR